MKVASILLLIARASLSMYPALRQHPPDFNFVVKQATGRGLSRVFKSHEQEIWTESKELSSVLGSIANTTHFDLRFVSRHRN